MVISVPKTWTKELRPEVIGPGAPDSHRLAYFLAVPSTGHDPYLITSAPELQVALPFDIIMSNYPRRKINNVGFGFCEKRTIHWQVES